MITIDDIGEITSRQRKMNNKLHQGKTLFIYSYDHSFNGKTYPCRIGSLQPMSSDLLKEMIVKSINERIQREATA